MANPQTLPSTTTPEQDRQENHEWQQLPPLTPTNYPYLPRRRPRISLDGPTAAGLMAFTPMQTPGLTTESAILSLMETNHMGSETASFCCRHAVLVAITPPDGTHPHPNTSLPKGCYYEQGDAGYLKNTAIFHYHGETGIATNRVHILPIAGENASGFNHNPVQIETVKGSGKHSEQTYHCPVYTDPPTTTGGDYMLNEGVDYINEQHLRADNPTAGDTRRRK
jgi:hypothetical protein